MQAHLRSTTPIPNISSRHQGYRHVNNTGHFPTDYRPETPPMEFTRTFDDVELGGAFKRTANSRSDSEGKFNWNDYLRVQGPNLYRSPSSPPPTALDLHHSMLTNSTPSLPRTTYSSTATVTAPTSTDLATQRQTLLGNNRNNSAIMRGATWGNSPKTGIERKQHEIQNYQNLLMQKRVRVQGDPEWRMSTPSFVNPEHSTLPSGPDPLIAHRRPSVPNIEDQSLPSTPSASGSLSPEQSSSSNSSGNATIRHGRRPSTPIGGQSQTYHGSNGEILYKTGHDSQG